MKPPKPPLIPDGWVPTHWLDHVRRLSRECYDAEVRTMFAELAETLAAEITRRGPEWSGRTTPIRNPMGTSRLPKVFPGRFDYGGKG